MRDAQSSGSRTVAAHSIAGLFGLALMNGLNLNTVPLINGVWSETLQLDPGRVGLLLTIQLLTAAIANIALSSRLHLVAPRPWGLGAGVILLATNLWFAVADAYWALLMGIVVMGLALGCLSACGAAAIAATGRVDRTAAIVSLGVTVLVAGLTLPVAHLADLAGRPGLFLAQAGVALLAIVLTWLLPGLRAEVAVPQAFPLLRAIRSPLVISSICLEMGTAGIWAFTERIGAAIGVSSVSVGDIIALSSLFGIAGALAATVLARSGRELALAVVAVVGFGVSTGVVPLAPDANYLLIAMSLQAAFFVFSGPFITAVSVAVDRSGGLAAAAHGWAMLTGALAPALTGVITRPGHFAHLAILALIATAISACALMAGARDRMGANRPRPLEL